jgi:preprotein translocase subunit SecE
MLKQTKIFRFYEQVKQEAFKVVWPERRELLMSTALVVVVIFVFSFFFLICDLGIHSLVQLLLNIGK